MATAELYLCGPWGWGSGRNRREIYGGVDITCQMMLEGVQFIFLAFPVLLVQLPFAAKTKGAGQPMPAFNPGQSSRYATAIGNVVNPGKQEQDFLKAA